MIDRNLAGRELGSVTFPVERGKLRELARALQDEDPVWSDAGAAADAGFTAIPLPPTFTVVADHWRSAGALEAALALGADLGRLLHGEAAWELLAPIRVGDELTATTRVGAITSREGRRGGTMTLASLETEYRDGAGGLVARRRDTLIEREA